MKRRRYDFVEPTEPAMGLEKYATLVTDELHLLLNSGECDERAFQTLLEDHPMLVPGVYPSLDTGHNGIWPSAVISQPPLTGLESKVPDFCVISADSGTVYATFVEIESPCKRWATGSGGQTAELTQAIQQIRDWKIWFKNPLNRARFMEEYRVPEHFRYARAFEQRYALVYGRRNEFEAAHFQKRRAEAQQPDEAFMTWDRLAPSNHYVSLITVRLSPRGYVALRIPPTTMIGPRDAEEWAVVADKDDALDASESLTQVRRDFLKNRWPYWDSWATEESEDEDRGIQVMSAQPYGE